MTLVNGAEGKKKHKDWTSESAELISQAYAWGNLRRRISILWVSWHQFVACKMTVIKTDLPISVVRLRLIYVKGKQSM